MHARRDPWVQLVVGCLVCIGLGCAHAIEIRTHDSADLSAYQSWAWRHMAVAASDELGAEEIALAQSIARQVEHSMSERGFAFERTAPDLLVTPTLEIRRRNQTIHRGQVMQRLVSHHSSPSYVIEGWTEEEVQVIESAELVIEIREAATNQLLWRGRLRGLFEDGFASHAAPSVAALMDPLPPSSGPAPDEGRAIARAPENDRVEAGR